MKKSLHVLDELSAYIDGESRDPEFIARHLQSCPECARRHVELLKLSTLFGTSVDRLLGRQEFVEDSTVNALFRATKGLDEGDRQQVLRFAEFLNQAGPAPKISMPGSDETQTT